MPSATSLFSMYLLCILLWLFDSIWLTFHCKTGLTHCRPGTEQMLNWTKLTVAQKQKLKLIIFKQHFSQSFANRRKIEIRLRHYCSTLVKIHLINRIREIYENEREWECKCLTCNQKLTVSQFNLLQKLLLSLEASHDNHISWQFGSVRSSSN